MTAIKVTDLTKEFKIKKNKKGLISGIKSLIKPSFINKKAVNNINLKVDSGESIAFIGPNGAGKSTTIKLLTGILHPTSGELKVLGQNPWRNRKKLSYQIGTVFGQRSQLWYHLPPIDSFSLMQGIYGIDPIEFKKQKKKLIELFEIEQYLYTPVRKLSLGERMRCEIAISLLHKPKLLFLDEPTIGLDVLVKHKIRKMIRNLNEEQKITIFLTSHDCGDIEALSKRTIFINEGKIILDKNVEEIKKNILKHKIINIKTNSTPKHIEKIEANVLNEGVEVLNKNENLIKLKINTNIIHIEKIIESIIKYNSIVDITVEDPDLEEVISTIYKGGEIGD